MPSINMGGYNVLQSHGIRNAVRGAELELALAVVLCADLWTVEEGLRSQHEGRDWVMETEDWTPRYLPGTRTIDGWSGEQENIFSMLDQPRGGVAIG